MKYLLVKEKGKKQYSLYCPDVFGFETWGSSSYQVSLSKKRKCWYKEVWIAGNEWVDDENYQYKLNVVLDTADFDEIIRCVTQRNEKELTIYLKMQEKFIISILIYVSGFVKDIKKKIK